MWHLIKQFTCINYTPTFHIKLDHRNAKIQIKSKTHFRWDTKDHLSIYYITLKGGNNLVYYRKRETIICNTLDPCQKDPNQNGNLMIKLHAIVWGSSKVINTRIGWHDTVMEVGVQANELWGNREWVRTFWDNEWSLGLSQNLKVLAWM